MRRGQFPGAATVDFLLNLVLVYVVINYLSLINVNTQSQNSVNTAALLVVLVEWSGTSYDDVDTYVQDGAKHLVYFKRLQDGLMNLERDDTGAANNEVTAPDGTKVKSAINQERVDIRGNVPGEYVVNIHMYRKSDSTPTPVSVTLFKMGQTVETLRRADLVLKEQGQEQTAFRFTLSKNGDVNEFNTLQKKFVNKIQTP